MKKNQKTKKNYINKKTNKFKLFINYAINHPTIILKAPIVLLISGPIEFIHKLKEIEYRQKKIELAKELTFSYILFWIFKLLINIITLIFRLMFSIFYLLFIFLFFFIFKLISITYLYKTPKKLKTSESKFKINGITFLIPTWNKRNLIINCLNKLDAISHESKVPLEIIVIDNGSNDQTYETLSSFSIKTKLNIIKLDTNIGFARAINLGAKKAKYNYIYLMNNDMIAQPRLISEIINFANKLISKDQLFFGLSSQVFFFDPKKQREESGKTYYFPDFGFLQVAHCINQENLLKPTITGYSGGGASLINKEIFLKLGGFDSSLYKPLYDEDLDLSFNAWKLGYPSYFVPSSRIIHHHRASSKKLNINPDYYIYKNLLIFMLKNYQSSSLFLKHFLLFSLRIITQFRFLDYAWQSLKFLPKILYKKVMLLKYKTIYHDYHLIDFPKFELKFYEK